MPRATKPTQTTKTAIAADPTDRAAVAVAWLKRHGTRATRDGMARYGLPSDKAFGVPVGVIQKYAKTLGPSHDLAAALWETGWYEARLLAAYVDEPERVTPAQMDRWCRGFDNWGVCDTVCFVLFDRTPHAWQRIAPWSKKTDEMGRRAAFALLACLARHDKQARDARFLRLLPLAERAAQDDRNFVKKGVLWAFRAIGLRSPALHAATLVVMRRLASSSDPPSRWIGKAALRELTAPAATKRLAAPRAAAAR